MWPTQGGSACEKASLSDGQKTDGGVVFKDLRRSFKSHMVAAEVIDAVRDAICGHSKKGMDVHYLQPSKEAIQAGMGRFTLWLDAEIRKVPVEVDKRLDGGETQEATTSVIG